MTVLKRYDDGTEAWEAIVVGKQGPVGPTGTGVPTGGTTGQSLVKQSDDDYDTGWDTLDAAGVGAIGTAVGLFVFDYGTAIPDVRPDAAAVYWRGTAAPGTAVSVPGDLWYDTTGLA